MADYCGSVCLSLLRQPIYNRLDNYTTSLCVAHSPRETLVGFALSHI